MKYPQLIIGAAIGLCASLIIACASGIPSTDTVSVPVQKGLTVARAIHAETCENVVRSHDAGVLTGDKFNKARQACITTDDQLDKADQLYQLGKVVESAGIANSVIKTLGGLL
jgi:hypothetical protein